MHTHNHHSDCCNSHNSNESAHNCCGHHHHHHGEGEHTSLLSRFRYEALSFLLMISGILLNYFHILPEGLPTLIFYLVALLPVGLPILKESLELWVKGDIFNEFTLMLLATVGAFWLGDYPEGVAILLFYSFGEKLEDSASDKARGRITSLLGKLPDTIDVIGADGGVRSVSPSEVNPGDIFRVLPGERVAVDAVLENESALDFNTAAITGESMPQSIQPGGEVISGAIPVDREARLRVLRPLSESTMTRIVKMIEDATARKSKSETLLRRITRYYTPTVMLAALLLFLVPMAVAFASGSEFDYRQWLYRSLVLLVCSCPCALVVSIPLSYFAAIGNASRFGILFKGSRYLDLLRSVRSLLIDKTGTITTGEFSVRSVKSFNDYSEDDVIAIAAAAEEKSTHPLAKAIVEYSRKRGLEKRRAEDIVVINHGISAVVDGKKILAGSSLLMRNEGIAVEASQSDVTTVLVAAEGKIIGEISLGDTIKDGVKHTFTELHRQGVKNITILSGDRQRAVAAVAQAVGADGYKAELLPEDKGRIVKEFSRDGKVMFVGDGINDAPSLASADVGVAIGTGGTDVAMESADAVIVGNSLEPLAKAIGVSRKIRRVVMENVSLAIGVKLLVMILGAFGIASLWAAVFADTGITLITILWTLLCLRSK